MEKKGLVQAERIVLHLLGTPLLWDRGVDGRSHARAVSQGEPLSPPRAVLRREALSRFHKCPVRRRGSRLGSKMSSWVQLLLALLAVCLRFGVAEVSSNQSSRNLFGHLRGISGPSEIRAL